MCFPNYNLPLQYFLYVRKKVPLPAKNLHLVRYLDSSAEDVMQMVQPMRVVHIGQPALVVNDWEADVLHLEGKVHHTTWNFGYSKIAGQQLKVYYRYSIHCTMYTVELV